MIRNTLPALIRYGKYTMPYHDNTLHKFSTLTQKQFNRQLFGMGIGLITFISSVYGGIYYSYSYNSMLFKPQLAKAQR